MPNALPKTWAAYDRLTAQDLNANFLKLNNLLPNGGFGMQAGRHAGVVFSASATSNIITVTYPTAFVSGTVIVMVTSSSQHYSITQNQGTVPGLTSFQVSGRYIPGTNASATIPFDWLAIGWMG